MVDRGEQGQLVESQFSLDRPTSSRLKRTFAVLTAVYSSFLVNDCNIAAILLVKSLREITAFLLKNHIVLHWTLQGCSCLAWKNHKRQRRAQQPSRSYESVRESKASERGNGCFGESELLLIWRRVHYLWSSWQEGRRTFPSGVYPFSL